MAPYQGPGKPALLKQLRRLLGAPKLPITLGKYEPQAVVDCVDGEWRIAALRMNEERSRVAGAAAIAAGETWMPEMTWQFLEQAEIIVSADSRRALADKVETLEWIWGP